MRYVVCFLTLCVLRKARTNLVDVGLLVCLVSVLS